MALLVCCLPALTLALPRSLTSAAQTTASDLIERAVKAAERGEHAEAVRLATQAIATGENSASAYYLRGCENFRLGMIREAVNDFDQFVALRPDLEPRQWERGIAYYYAGQYEKGARQFALYQTYHDNDVENSVWRYLCMVPLVGVQEARSQMLPIENDRRVPMMQIYDLYRGKLKPSDVLEAAHAGDASGEVLAGRLFYAHLYLGLYHQAEGEDELARKYILLAADEKLKENRRISRYMLDVARIHARLRHNQDRK